MAKLLHVEASPRKERSASIEVAKAFREGYKGLITVKKAAVVYARGGAYPAGSGGEAFDLQKRYMEQFLVFIGFTDITPIVVEPTLGKPESVERMKAEAAARARSAAGVF